MKKIILFLALAMLAFHSYAQDESGGATSKGSWLIEVNTNSSTTGNTGFSLASVDGNTAWSAGAEAGYAVIDDLFVKVGLGYADFGGDIESSFLYKIGAKYYVSEQIPVGVDFTGASSDGNNANWVGLQAGYAWFISDNIAIEPTLRYNLTLDELKADSIFQGLIGFSIFLD